MTNIRAFQALRPTPDLAKKIASLPYDVVDSNEARSLRQENEYSFLRINKPEVDLPNLKETHSEEVYLKGKQNLTEFTQNKWLIKEASPCLYIYTQKMGQHQQTGIVCCSHIDDYFNDIIKKHEFTRPDKEKDRIDHMSVLSAHIGPVFLTYRPVDQIDSIVNQWKSAHKPIYDFESTDGIAHTVWVVDQPEIIERLLDLFKKQVPHTYVADGHHRSAASAKVGMQRRKEDSSANNNKEYDYFLSVLFPSNQLSILDYNRVIKDLNGLSFQDFLEKVQLHFNISKSASAYKPAHIHSFGMYVNGQWYSLKAKQETIKQRNHKNPVEMLDIQILSDYIISPILGIKDQRTSQRIDFVGGIRGLNALEKRVDSGEMTIAFSIPPVTVHQLLEVADANRVMPPKSTWFEPKLRSGLFIHQF